MADFAVETYAQVIDEIGPMLPAHWAELAVHKDIPLDPDFDFYKKADEIGLLEIMTVRKDGVLIGYALWVVKRHPHYKAHSWAINDIIWLRPDHRRENIGSSFIAFWEAEFRRKNVSVVHVETKIASTALMFLLMKNGYQATSAGVEKRLV
ncbi:MAG: GNAT family N-acetyltransferase [Patescibacteria group bacterium]|nr:GNAT family N-acetyltransferase [Patescibacteria group bacterium]